MLSVRASEADGIVNHEGVGEGSGLLLTRGFHNLKAPEKHWWVHRLLGVGKKLGGGACPALQLISG